MGQNCRRDGPIVNRGFHSFGVEITMSGQIRQSRKAYPIALRTAALFLAAVLLGSCNYRSEPEQAIQAYAAALQDDRCDDALKLMSTRTRHAIAVLRVNPQHPQNPLPTENYYCNRLTFEDCKLGKMTLSEHHNDNLYKLVLTLPGILLCNLNYHRP